MRHVVLLVDDEPKVLKSLLRALSDEPFELVTSSSPLEAIQIVRAGRIDAVVSDQDMPAMTGTKLLAWVHRHHPDVVRFILTGRASLEVAIDAINEGAIHRFFTKPCNAVDLAFSLRHALQQADLFVRARTLYAQARAQDALLAELEQRQPGITRVRRDEHGAVLLDELPRDVDDLIDKMDSFMDGLREDS